VSWPRNPVTYASAHSPVHGKGGGGADLTGQANSVEKEKTTRGATTRQLANRACEAKREEGHAGEETGSDRSAPMGSEQERESA
jgi:hypothetical protein